MQSYRVMSDLSLFLQLLFKSIQITRIKSTESKTYFFLPLEVSLD